MCYCIAVQDVVLFGMVLWGQLGFDGVGCVKVWILYCKLGFGVLLHVKVM